MTAEFSFKPLHGYAQGWLRNAASFCRAREAQLFTCGEKVYDLLHFHGRLT